LRGCHKRDLTVAGSRIIPGDASARYASFTLAPFATLVSSA